MQNEKIDPNKAYQTLVIIWAALLISQVLFLIMIYLVKPEVYRFEFTQPIGGKDPIFVIALAAAAVFNFLLSFKMRRKSLTESVEKQNVGLVQTAMIIGCALGESISLFGLLLVFVQDYQYFFLFFALGILTTLLSFPRRDDVMAASFKKP
jgi:F0F1-type ATP synthase membrane subunit c/vacuolar-type H+-ATPase subunit K